MPTYLHRDRTAIIFWLSFCLLLVAGMVLIGGYTRLSGSGLSITAWKPIHGTIPPLSGSEWQEEFAAYQHTPQYEQVNRGMTLEEFKEIFWPEYTHRLLGRIIGAVFLLPFLVFLARRSLATGYAWRLASIFALGGLQGGVGWLMVKSGLIDTPYVSPVRLALHLAIAFTIFALLLWAVWPLSRPHLARIDSSARRWYRLWLATLFVQIILGAFMAGTHAGLIYNTWPTMNGEWVPQGLLDSHITLIQFAHRSVAMLVALGYLFWWYCQRLYVKNNHLGKACSWVACLIAFQFALGVVTLLHQAPLSLALAHQLTALLLWMKSVRLFYKLSWQKMKAA